MSCLGGRLKKFKVLEFAVAMSVQVLVACYFNFFFGTKEEEISHFETR